MSEPQRSTSAGRPHRAIVLAAHGSRTEPEVNAMLHAWAAELERSVSDCAVRAAFHQGSPGFAEVLDAVAAGDVTVVPVMTSEGYYCDVVLPRELARNRRYAEVTLRITPPVGTHVGIAALIASRVAELSRASETAGGFDPAQATLVIVGHGTERHHRSRQATEQLVATLQSRRVCGQVITALLDEPPGVETILARAEHNVVIVIPFLIGAGFHATRDIPGRMGAAARSDPSLPRSETIAGSTVLFDFPIGHHPGLLDIIRDLANAENPRKRGSANTQRTLRLGTRGSKLALWQAERIAGELRQSGRRIEIVKIDTSGDTDRHTPIESLISPAPFTDAIEAALLDGRIDLAVHSLKDLPLRSDPRLALAAILPRGDASEALVSSGNLTLDALRKGAIVGTSSPRRVAQLLALRPDLQTRPIRGPVDDRVAQVRAGRFDAAVFATAGLDRLGLLAEIAERFEIGRFLPAPGQAALAVQVRKDDAETAELVGHLDDLQTRACTNAEIALLGCFEEDPRVTVAAFARHQGDGIHLQARLMSLDGRSVCDAAAFAPSAEQAAEKIAERFRQSLHL